MLAGGVITAKASGRSQHKTERKIMNQYEKDILWAAGQFLYDDLPNNWKDWSQKELYSFVEQHAWEPFQYWSGSKLWTHIIDLAESMRKYAQEN